LFIYAKDLLFEVVLVALSPAAGSPGLRELAKNFLLIRKKFFFAGGPIG